MKTFQTYIDPLLDLDHPKSHYPVSARLEPFEHAIETIAIAARRAANKAVSRYKAAKKELNPQPTVIEDHEPLASMVEEIRRYEHLATDMEHLRDARLPLVPRGTTLEMNVPLEGYGDFVSVLGKKEFSLLNLSIAKRWFESASEATDRHIPRNIIMSEARNFIKRGHATALLRHQFHDDHWGACAIETLKQSDYGTDLMRQAEGYGYSFRFVDMRPLNLALRDLRKNGPTDTTASGFFETNGGIFVDTHDTPNTIHRAIKLGHECCHAAQCHGSLRHEVFADNKFPIIGSQKDIKSHISTLEAHCVGEEYAIAAELLLKGFDVKEIHGALYGFPPHIINLLIDNPAGFIERVSQSETMQRVWDLAPEEMVPSPELARLLAESLNALPAPWEELPQPVPARTEARHMPAMTANAMPIGVAALGN